MEKRSQSHRIIWIGRDPQGSLSPTPGPAQDTPRVEPWAWEHSPNTSWTLSNTLLLNSAIIWLFQITSSFCSQMFLSSTAGDAVPFSFTVKTHSLLVMHFCLFFWLKCDDGIKRRKCSEIIWYLSFQVFLSNWNRKYFNTSFFGEVLVSCLAFPNGKRVFFLIDFQVITLLLPPLFLKEKKKSAIFYIMSENFWLVSVICQNIFFFSHPNYL